MDNLRMKEYEKALVEVTNAAQIPIEAKRLIMENVLRKVEAAADAAIRAEIDAKKEENEDGPVHAD